MPVPWLYKQPESDCWWIGYRVAGKQIRRSTGKTDRKEAEKELATLNIMQQAQRSGLLTEDFYRTLTGRQITAITLKAAVNDWRDTNKNTTAKNTAVRYKEVTEQFMTYMEANDSKPRLRDIESKTITGFLNHLSKTLSASSVKLVRKILSMFFGFAVRAKYIADNPVKGTKPPKAAKQDVVERRAFTMTELRDLWAKAPDDFWRYMLTGGLYTGLRMGDLICLAKSEVKLGDNVLKLTTRKTRTPVEIPIAAPFRAILERLVKQCKGKYLWPEQAEVYLQRGAGAFSNGFYEDILVPAGLVPKRTKKAKEDGNGRKGRRTTNDISYHCLRHSFVSLLKLSGASGVVAKELAGHASDEVNELYTHVPLELMQAAIKLLPEVTRS